MATKSFSCRCLCLARVSNPVPPLGPLPEQSRDGAPVSCSKLTSAVLAPKLGGSAFQTSCSSSISPVAILPIITAIPTAPARHLSERALGIWHLAQIRERAFRGYRPTSTCIDPAGIFAAAIVFRLLEDHGARAVADRTAAIQYTCLH